MFALQMPVLYHHKNWLCLRFLEGPEEWTGVAVPQVLAPQTLVRLHYGGGTKPAAEWLLVKFCFVSWG